MADDAGALLVRSGLVSAKALDEARARVASIGGTLGEQLVIQSVVSDDDLTDFYRSRLLVPQVNPNLLARLSPKVIATIPSDMAIELRAIPVSLDGDNNLTVAMSDPSDRHAVDEIAFFTGAYIVRAVATQMQIAWCLAHYYGHITALGQRLLYATESTSPIQAAISEAPQRPARTRGLTDKVDAARHRAIAPGAGPVDVLPQAPARVPAPPAADAPAGTPGPTLASATASTAQLSPNGVTPPTPVSMPASAPRITPSTSTPAAPPRTTPATGMPTTAPRLSPSNSTLAAAARLTPSTSTPAQAPRLTPTTTSVATIPSSELTTPTPPTPLSMPASAPRITPSSTAAVGPAKRDETTPVIIELDDETSEDAPTIRRPSSPDILAPKSDAPDPSRARSVSGEIRVPSRRAASIRAPMPPPGTDDTDEPLIVIEPSGSDEDIDLRTPTRRRRAVKSDPPELYARAGEVDLKPSGDRSIDADEPRIVIDENALAPPTTVQANRAQHRDVTAAQVTAESLDDLDTEAQVHAHVIEESQPILLDRPRTTSGSFQAPAAPPAASPPGAATAPVTGSPHDAGERTIVVLDAKKPRSRPERRTQVGIPPAPVPVRPHRDSKTTGVPTLERAVLDRTMPVDPVDEDATTLDLWPAPPDDDTSDEIVAPPAPAGYGDSNPHFLAPPPKPAPPRTTAIQPAVIIEDDREEPDDDDDDDD
ncbi:MAG TPA: hypothetical protein VHN14_23860, partial [Kofleriaceae bacterium]|nr:hypothetical protein [Kofleriaceae bacterium]